LVATSRFTDIRILATDSDDGVTMFFVRASSPPPVTFAEPWNTPPGAGSFKPIGVARRRRAP